MYLQSSLKPRLKVLQQIFLSSRLRWLRRHPVRCPWWRQTNPKTLPSPSAREAWAPMTSAQPLRGVFQQQQTAAKKALNQPEPAWKLFSLSHSQIWSAVSESGLSGASGTFYPIGVWDEATAELREGRAAARGPERRGPIHEPLWENPTPCSADQHPHFHGQLPREHETSAAGQFTSLFGCCT